MTTPTTPQAAFLQAICESPHDDTPRLMYAADPHCLILRPGVADTGRVGATCPASVVCGCGTFAICVEGETR